MRHLPLLLLLLLAHPCSSSPGADFAQKLANVSPQVEEMLAGKRPLPTTYDDLSCLGSHVLALPDSPKDPAWTTQKLVKLRLMTQIVQIADRLVVPNFDFSKKPMMNVIPPAAAGVPSGVDPRAIRDPALHAEYKASLAANEKLAHAYILQNRLGKYKTRWLGYIDSFSSQYFSAEEMKQADTILDTLKAADAKAIRKKTRSQTAK